MIFKIRKNSPKAKIPAYALEGDAGLDLFSIEKKIIKQGGISKVRTGIEIELPPKTVGLIWDKSGIAGNFGIKTMGGVFDENYRGELIIIMTNLSNKPHKIEIGDKIAQLLIQKIEYPKIKVVKKLSDSNRGKGRLGSTGRR